jgi:Kef-type K+ transport system membrane component KefB
MPSFRLIAGYVCLVGLPLLILLMVLNSGGTFAHPALLHLQPTAEVTPRRSIVSGSFLLILQVIVILSATRIAGAAAHRMGQPHVIGEMMAGVMLGPSVAGWLFPALSAAVFPVSSLEHLEVLSQLGLVVFMFLVGVSLDTTRLREHCHAAILTSHVSIVMPLVLGTALASLLYPSFAGDGVGFPVFALFMGTAMSITAFPVLARILSERKLLRSRAGTLAIACAAVDDVTGWCILAYIMALIRTSRAGVPMSMTIAGSLVFAAVMIFAVRPFLSRFERLFEDDEAGNRVLVPVVLFLLASSLTTEFLGIHLLFGSFLAGAVMPKSERTVAYLQGRLEPFSLDVLMPLFFAFTGLRTTLGLLRGSAMWQVFGMIVAVAVAGKLGGATIAARLAGFGWRDSAAVGSLLNTRGLMELVILNIGLEVGILTPGLFTLMVMMAILTTIMTAPLLHWLRPSSMTVVQVRYEENQRATGPVAG